MPEGAIYVGRPSTWGNPFRVGGTIGYVGLLGHEPSDRVIDRAHALRLYREWVKRGLCGWDFRYLARYSLSGHDLACWCPLDQPCHADVLLALANGEAS